MSLISVLVAVGLSSIIMMAITSLITMAVQGVRTTEVGAAYSQLLNEINTVLSNKDLCTKALSGQRGTNNSNIRMSYSPTNAVAERGLNRMGIEITEFRLVDVTPLGAPGDNQYFGNLNLRIEKKGTVFGSKNRFSKFGFYYTRNGNRIESCYGAGTLEGLCTSLGGTWENGDCDIGDIVDRRACEVTGGTYSRTTGRCTRDNTSRAPSGTVIAGCTCTSDSRVTCWGGAECTSWQIGSGVQRRTLCTPTNIVPNIPATCPPQTTAVGNLRTSDDSSAGQSCYGNVLCAQD